MRIVAIIQARFGSSRLPGKILEELDGTAILGHVVARTQQIPKVDDVVVATTESDADNAVAEYVNKMGTSLFRGSEDDVLARYYHCATTFDATSIVRITGDCPVTDPEIGGQVVDRFLQGDVDYVSNCHPPTFPDGISIEIFSFKALEDAFKNARRPSEREHVTPYFWRQPDRFKLANVSQADDRSTLRWTVDTQKDLEMMRRMTAVLPMPLSQARQNDLLDITRSYPELMEINVGSVRYAKLNSMLEHEDSLMDEDLA